MTRTKHSCAAVLAAVTLLGACETKPASPPPQSAAAANPSASSTGAPPPAPLPAPERPSAPDTAASPPTASGPEIAPAADPRTPRLSPSIFRGLWVTRFDFRTAGDVQRAVEEAATLGTTDILWQVRGQADAFYQSELEPWGVELLRDRPAGAASPGFDPLKVAVDAAHRRGMRLHAWINVMPLWKGTTPPANPKHPYNAHPGWRLFDSTGKAQPLNDHYVIVNPVLDEVQDHIVAVCRDVVERYGVDGLHLDYIRFVSEKMEARGATLPGDPRSLAMFRAATGHASPAGPAASAAFQAWKRSHITRLVHRIREEATSVRPGVALTAAVWRRPELARDQYLQDSALWLNEGSIDRAIPMIYTDKDEQFESDLKAWIAATPGRPVSPGLGTYMHALGQTPVQLEKAFTLSRSGGYCLFSYAALFETVDPSQRKDAKSVQERSSRRATILEYLRSRDTDAG